MFQDGDEKLQQAKNQLFELIGELDVHLEDVRSQRRQTVGHDGHESEPEWLQPFERQREVLATVCMMLADMSFAYRGELQRESER